MEEKKPTVTDERPLSLEKIERQVWLVKVPTFLAKHFEDNPARDVGAIKKNGSRTQLELTGEDLPDDLPQTYNLKFNRMEDTYVFSEARGGGLAMEGSVVRKIDCAPSLTDPKYLKALKTRTTRLEPKNRTARTRKLGDDEAHFLSVDATLIKRSRKEVERTKRDRIPEEELLNMIFELFSKQTHWTLRAIEKETNQPVSYLREQLNRLADKETSGPHKNTYALKPEYRS